MPDGHFHMLSAGGSLGIQPGSPKNPVLRLLAAAHSSLTQAWMHLTASAATSAPGANIAAAAKPVAPVAIAEAAHDRDSPSVDECRAALDRIVASKIFASAPRVTAFLRFVADAALSGHARSLKAYTVALGALDRGENFDPVSDPAVRVTAGRVRKALARYYAGPGAADPIAITMPLGTYVPVFSRRGGE